MSNVWVCANGGPAGRPGLRFRDAFLGTVAAGALSLALSSPALAGPDACTIDGTGTIETCTGNQSAGIAIASPTTLTTLNVNTLTQAIAPASGTRGISFVSDGDITITSNTGAFGITTAGDNATGISARSNNGAVTVTSTGNITTGGTGADGIFAYSEGAVTVTSTGNISTAGASGVFAYSTGAGAVTVTSTGNISGFAGGIIAVGNGTGAVMVTSTGNITTAGNDATGIYAESNNGGAVTVTSTGNITTAGNYARGIDARSYVGGAVTVTSTGNISTAGTKAYGIYARSGGAVAVTSAGNITTAGSNAFGIKAYSQSGAVTVTSAGNIATTGAGASGISARGNNGAVAVTSTGNITTAGSNAFGINAFSQSGVVTVTSTGNISTAGDFASGLYAYSFRGGAVTVTVSSTGNITTTGNKAYGIHAVSKGAAAVTVTSTGNITTTGTNAYGIFAYSRSAGAVTVTSTGNIATAGDNARGIFALGIGAGAVTVTSTGNIATTGTYAYGIFARGNGAGAVTVTSAGNISTAGNGAKGIYAYSNTGPIAVTIKSGTVSGGSRRGAGVDLIGSSTNTLTNFGTVTALSGLAILSEIGNSTVNNFGTVIGNVILRDDANAFNNLAGGFFNSGVTVNLGAAGNTLTNAGTLSPGGAGTIQTTALTGNLVQSATGRLFSDINIAGATSDRVSISGTAALAGAVQVQVLNATLGPWQQTVLSATGGTTINGLSLLASPLLHAQLVFPNATDVAVASAGLNFLTPGLNNNQTSLANAFNGAAQTGSGGIGGPVVNFLLNGLTSLAGYGVVLNQLSGETAVGSQQTTFNAMGQFMGLLTDPFMNRGGGFNAAPGASGYADEASAYAASKKTDAFAMFTKAPPQTFEQRWSVWGAGFGGSQNTNGNTAVGTNNTTSNIAGTAVGADYLFSPNTIAGFALAGGGTSFSVANGGTGRSDLFQAGAYIRHWNGPAYVSAALAYGWQDITTNRTLALAGIDQLRAEFNANAWSGRLEGGYRFVTPWSAGIGITPYAAAQFVTFDLPAYAEQAIVGTNNFALSYGAKDVTDARAELGFRTDKSFVVPDGILTLRGRFAWAHDFDPDRSIGATFQTLPGASFVVNGAAQAADSALTTASIEMKWRNNWSVAATFEGEFSNVTTSYAGKGVVRYQW